MWMDEVGEHWDLLWKANSKDESSTLLNSPQSKVFTESEHKQPLSKTPLLVTLDILWFDKARF